MREDLFRNLKLISAAKERSMQELLEKAVTQYLATDDLHMKH